MRILLGILLLSVGLKAQTTFTLNPASPIAPGSPNGSPGVFFVPKTQAAFNSLFNSGVQFKAIRLNVIESALNNSSNLTQCLALLEQTRNDVVAVNQRCDHLVLIFEKMPAWLSSSSNPSPAQTPGWSVLNTKPPANWNTWQTVVDSIVNKINNQWGLDPYYEVWNEPDLGSWTGTNAEYMRLFRTTRAGIKSADATAKVGGPALNYWANGLSRTFIPEKIHPDTFSLHSLTAQLVDSMLVSNTLPDFLSWHSFIYGTEDAMYAAATVRQFLIARGITNPIPFILSEWNAPSQVRDLPACFAFQAYQNCYFNSLPGYSFTCIAAWQDFSPSTNEFHQDYGLLSYGALEKPGWKMMEAYVKMQSNQTFSVYQSPYTNSRNILSYASYSGDTLRLFIVNRNMPGLVAALETMLYGGGLTLKQLDTDNYIDLQTGNVNRLDSALKGLLPVSGNLPSDSYILNSGIPEFHTQDSLWQHPFLFDISVLYQTGTLPATLYRIDSTHNNIIYRYDSLRTAGYTQSNAINYLLPQQQLRSETVTLTNGMISLVIQPNSCILLELPGVITSITAHQTRTFTIYPNPANQQVTLTANENITRWQLFNNIGQCINSGTEAGNQLTISTLALANGMYFMQLETASGILQKQFTIAH